MSIPSPAWLPSLCAVCALAALWMSEPARSHLDLQMSVSDTVARGQSTGVRAWVFDDRGGAPEVVPANLELIVQGPTGSVFMQHRLTPAAVPASGVEGTIALPDACNPCTIKARTVVEGQELQLAKTIAVASAPLSRTNQVDDIAALEQANQVDDVAVSEHARQVNGDAGSHRDAASFAVRVEGGACVPGLVCNLWIRVPQFAKRVSVQALVGVEFGGKSPYRLSLRRPSSGMVRVPVRIRGNEAAIGIANAAVATAPNTNGVPTSFKRFAVPMVFGGIAANGTLEEAANSDQQAVRLRYATVDGPRPLLVDIYRQGRWISATSVAETGALVSFAGATMHPHTRVQLRRDVFTTKPVGVVDVVSDASTAAASEPPQIALPPSQDPRRPSQTEGTNLSERNPSSERALFELADQASAIWLPPNAVSSRREGQRDADRQQRDRSLWATAFIIVVGFVASAVLFRQEIALRERDRSLRDAAAALGAPLEPNAFRRRAMWVVGFAVLSFVAVIAMSRWWL